MKTTPRFSSLWTTKQPVEGIRDTNKAMIISLVPDICLTPVGSSVVPVPYPVIDFCDHSQNYTSTVKFTGQKAMIMKSSTAHVHGDEPGTNKGVKSGTVGGKCEPIGHAASVRGEGAYLIRHLDSFWMNNRNTIGQVIFTSNMQTYAPLQDDDPISESLGLGDKAEGVAGGDTVQKISAGGVRVSQ